MNASEIATLISWSRVLVEVGVDPGRGGRTRCPVHNGDNPIAFSYYDQIGKAH